MHSTNIKLIADHAGLTENQIKYLPELSYPCGQSKAWLLTGMHNCCYRMVYQTPIGLFAVDYRCGCESQTVPDGSRESLCVCGL